LFKRYEKDLLAGDRIRIEGPLRAETEGRLVMDVAGEVGGLATTSSAAAGLPVSGLPVGDYKLTSGFGAARGGDTHNGVDLAVPPGTVVRSTIAGVAKVVENERGGKQVIVVSEDGRTRIGVAHLSAQNVKTGDKIAAGQEIGLSGNTGRSTGPHVHYTLTIDGQKVDPLHPPTGAGAKAHPVARGVSLEDKLALARRRLLDRDPNASPRMIRDLDAQVTRDHQVHRASVDEGKEAAVSAAQRWFIQNPGKTIRQMPAGLRSAIPADHYDDLIGYGERVAAPQRDQATSDRLYGYYLGNPDEVRKLSESQFQKLYGQLDRGSFIQLAQMRGAKVSEAEQNRGGQVNQAAYKVATDQYLTTLGYDPGVKPDGEGAAEVGGIRASVWNAIVAEQAQRGKQMTDVEVTSFVARYLMNRTVEVRRGGGMFSDGTVARAPIGTIRYKNLAPAARKKIEDALRVRNIEPTETNVMAAYYAGAGG
jgi:murein DD-endopeptidase MepM/ murein hydrolase activator NlpD